MSDNEPYPRSLSVPPRSEIAAQPEDFPEVWLSEEGIDFGIKVDRDTWVRLGNWLGTVNTKSKIWLADWASENDRRQWGFTDDDLAEITGLDKETIQNYRYVGRHVRKDVRQPGQPLTHLQAVAPLEAPDQRTLLKRGKEEEWDRDMLRDATRQVQVGIAADLVKPRTPAESHARVTDDDVTESGNSANEENSAPQSHARVTGVPPAGVAEYELYTPEWLIVKARLALGGEIDLDPASCKEAQTVVRANRYYDISSSGLTLPWASTGVWVNPPYGNGYNKPWSEKIIWEFMNGGAMKIIALMPASIGSDWYTPFEDFPRCEVSKRIAFWGPADKGDGPRFGSVIFNLGVPMELFAEAFEDIGAIYIRYQRGGNGHT